MITQSALSAAQQRRRDLHLHRLQACAEARAFADAVAEAIGLPLTQLHEYVGPYPLFQPGADNSTDTHHVQVIPTYRFGLPGNRWVGSFHRDSDFGHSGYELNAICALTPMPASAALHVEQTAGAHDFAPMDLQAGEVILFDHIDRLHGCPLNREGVSVASIDFRFVPVRFAAAAFRDAASSINTGTAFLPGHYFTAEPL